MAQKTPAEKLVDFIEKHPECEFHIDNDGWYITKLNGEKMIADSSDYDWLTDWYDHSGNYGGGLAEAMVILLNRRGFKIQAHSV